jgi:RsiW-degrading membrane proteinase PrsW (M82 family)
MLINPEIIILIFTAFLPPIIYAIWIRNTERVHRERWKAIAVCFLWGATVSIIAALILEIILDIQIIGGRNTVKMRMDCFILSVFNV